MAVLGEVFLQVVAFCTGLLVLMYLGMGVYMQVSHRDPFAGGIAQPRSRFQLLSGLFVSLMLFASFVSLLIGKASSLARAAVLAVGVISLMAAGYFTIKLLRTPSK